jgi:hypothetical protein
MIRGTTPTLNFTIPFDTGLISEAFVTLSQNEQVVVEKRLEDCSVDKRKLSVRLTQEETLKLSCDCKTEIQIRAKTTVGEAIASDIFTVDTGRILKDGVI